MYKTYTVDMNTSRTPEEGAPTHNTTWPNGTIPASSYYSICLSLHVISGFVTADNRYLNLQYLNLNVSGSAPNQSCYQPSAGGLLALVLRPNLSILAPGNRGTLPKARDELA